LTGLKPDGGEQPDGDLRQLEFKKNQYGQTGEKIVLRYQRGLFLPEGGISSLDKLAREQKAEEVFLTLLVRFTRDGRNVSEKPTAPNYATTSFCRESEAKAQGIRKQDLVEAMRRLFEAKKIRVEQYGRQQGQHQNLSKSNKQTSLLTQSGQRPRLPPCLCLTSCPGSWYSLRAGVPLPRG
jgi:RecA-family ATPase